MPRHRPTPPRRAFTLALVLAPLITPSTLGAQDGTTFGLGFGPIASYPDDFTGGGCDGRYVGIDLGARRSVMGAVALEANLAWTGSASTSCLTDALSRPAPLDGETYRLTTVPDAIRGETFWATRLGAVITPWELGPVTPRLRLSGGRLWSKELWTWTWGTGVRYRFGSQGIVLDVERWNLGYDVVDETWVYRDGGPDELRRRDTIERRSRPWFVRVGWEWSVGR